MNTMTENTRSERLTQLGLLQETLGYVDGGNVYEYVHARPSSLVDPEGTEAQQTTLGIKGMEFKNRPGDPPLLTIAWTEIEGADVYIVQHVKVTVIIKDCATGQRNKKKERSIAYNIDRYALDPSADGTYEYYESWHSHKGQMGYDTPPKVVIMNDDTGTPGFIPLPEGQYHDGFSFGSVNDLLENSSGVMKLEGWAKVVSKDPKFYMNAATGHDTSSPWSLALPSQKNPPNGWTDSGTIYHWLSWKWDHEKGKPNLDDIDGWPKSGDINT